MNKGRLHEEKDLLTSRFESLEQSKVTLPSEHEEKDSTEVDTRSSLRRLSLVINYGGLDNMQHIAFDSKEVPLLQFAHSV